MEQIIERELTNILQSLKIDGSCIASRSHRHLAFYDVRLKPGASINRLERYAREIALGLRSKTVPLMKFMPEEGIVRLQVANAESELLPLNNFFEDTWIPSLPQLPIILGETDEGKELWIDLAQHPHTLIAGGTGSGKSTMLHNIIANISRLNYLEERIVNLYLGDPKSVEFTCYDDTDLAQSVSTNYTDIILMLEHIKIVMDERYKWMAKEGISKIDNTTGMAYYVVIIDEVADLMLQDKKLKKFETLVTMIAQKCRAAGIFLIMATQRPSVDVLTGLIKANFPARISCKVATKIDSQVILDAPGAERLLGRGDAVLQSPEMSRARFQVAYVDPKETIANYG